MFVVFFFIISHIDYWNYLSLYLLINNQQQKDILRQIFGELTVAKLSIIGLTLGALIALLLGLYILPMMRNRSLNPLASEYRKSVDLLKNRLNIPRATLGPQDFMLRVRDSADVSIANVFEKITQAYIETEYQPATTPIDGVKRLQQLRRELGRELKKTGD